MSDEELVAAVSAGVEYGPYAPCVDCREEPGSCPDSRCRDCDISFISSGTTCRECLVAIFREEVSGPHEAQHIPTCSLRAVRDYGPRTDDEQWAIRLAKFGERRPVAPGATCDDFEVRAMDHVFTLLGCAPLKEHG